MSAECPVGELLKKTLDGLLKVGWVIVATFSDNVIVRKGNERMILDNQRGAWFSYRTDDNGKLKN